MGNFQVSRMVRHPKGPGIAGPSIGFFFALVSSVLFLSKGPLSLPAGGIIGASLLMLVFGMFDDAKEQSVAAKLILQVVAATVLYLCGVRSQIEGIGTAGNIAVTYLWVLGITNAVNHLDIADGLAAGVVTMIGGALAAIALFNGDALMALLAILAASLSLFFLMFNLPPARFYLGNSGSHFFGFLLAAIALGISYAPAERRIALLSPLFIFGFPIFDTLFLASMRIKKGRSALHKSDDHLAMRFYRMGLSIRRTLSLLLGLSLFFCLSGLALSKTPNIPGLLVIAVVFLVSFSLALRMNSEDGD